MSVGPACPLPQVFVLMQLSAELRSSAGVASLMDCSAEPTVGYEAVSDGSLPAP